MSKALEMSIGATRDLRAELEWLRPSRVYCMSELSRVEVDWRARKPNWVGERGRKGEILSRTSLSKILEGIQSKEIGR